MAQLTPEEFEALWQEAQRGPAPITPTPAPDLHLDMSLTTILDRYGALADAFLGQQKINKLQHDALTAAIAALKAALAAINEKDLVAQHFAQAASTAQQQFQARLARAVQPG